MTATADSRQVDCCRICGGTDLKPYLDLGEMPLANDLRAPDETEPETRFPLAVLFCPDCGLSQLSVVVSAERMFRHYLYRSSISETFKRHCASLADEASCEAALADGALVADIGSNDGPLLGAFLERGYKTVGIDPARNLAEIARAGGIDVLPEFWGRAAAETLVEKWGKPSLMTATNVFAHVDDLDDFMGGIAHALADDGRFMLEVPYLSDLVEKNEFDTVYHEHLSYFLLRPLLRIAEKHGLTPAYVRRIPVHGGGLRVYLKRGETPDVYPDSVRAVLDFERDAGLYETQPYERFAREIDSIRRDVRSTLGRLRAEGKTIAAFGASAKGAVLLNAVDADAETISFIVDDTPEKQGLIAPGTGVPVVSAEKLTEAQPDFLLILAWNFIDEILDRTVAFREAGGRYIVPVPALRYID
jgi:novobiocin biosynthesis protein NovU/D-mycarose 3-C-methyltransferase